MGELPHRNPQTVWNLSDYNGFGGVHYLPDVSGPFTYGLVGRPNHKKERSYKIPENKSTPRINRTITVLFDQQKYAEVVKISIFSEMNWMRLSKPVLSCFRRISKWGIV